jgi:hypothetical protein
MAPRTHLFPSFKETQDIADIRFSTLDGQMVDPMALKKMIQTLLRTLLHFMITL